MAEGTNALLQLEAAGASYISVHGRTVRQRTEPIDYEAIRTIVDALSIPVVANGDVTSRAQTIEVAKRTGCKGVRVPLLL